MESLHELQVFLDAIPVGALTIDRHERSEFRLFESYKQSYPRPILGQVFMDDLDRIYSTRSRMPPWFSNLLPEGPLRDLIAERAGVFRTREFQLLHHLGEDLPGAIRIVSAKPAFDDDSPKDTRDHEQDDQDPWRFSLAGVQLKFSAKRNDRGLTIPISGRGGDWIVKLPDARYPGVPDNEYATMRWAEASGIPIPAIELLDIDKISGISAIKQTFAEPRAFAIKRFDRAPSGARVHMEDFAQVLDLYPEEKYKKYNYETLAKIILELVGGDGLSDFLRRLIFNIATGNGDAHHKNWSLLYPDGVTAKLSPAYDLVSTIQYIDSDRLALNLAKSKQWTDVRLESFRRLARKIDIDEEPIIESVRSATAAIQTAWHDSNADFGFGPSARRKIAAHLASIPLFKN